MLNYSNTKVTMELRDVLASRDANGQPFKLWDFEYPSYYKGDEKLAFEQKVIDHYLFHQIGVETIARFKHNFKTRIREIMPYYVQLYESEKYMKNLEDPFATVDYTETFEQEFAEESDGKNNVKVNVTGNNKDTRNTTNGHEQKYSDTPQGSVQNISDGYLTNYTEDTNTTNDELITENSNETLSEGGSEGSKSGTVKHTLTKKGAMGVTTFGHDMIEFRQSFLNIDKMIIGELRDLFLLVY